MDAVSKVATGLAATTITIFFLTLLALGPGNFIPVLTAQDTYVIGHGYGQSMEPYISTGDYLLVDITPEELEIGDIVVYKVLYDTDNDGEKETMLIGHRIVRTVNDKYITKGDNVPTVDEPLVEEEQIFGEVEGVTRNPVLKRVLEIWVQGID